MSQKKMTDEEFIRSMAESDSLIDHDPEQCGICGHQFIMATVAREMLASGDFANAVHRWADEAQKRWRASKYVKLWEDEKAAGRDPKAAFAERGWEP